MKRRALPSILPLTICLLLAWGAPLPAQEAALTGQVTAAEGGAPLAGAVVSIPALDVETVTDAEGNYRLPLPAHAAGQTVEVRASMPPFQSAATELQLSGPSSLDFALGLSFHESITVGSRAPGAAGEKAVPVDVLAPEAIETAGASETSQIIQALSPSFNFPRTTITDGSDTVRPATMRGLGSDQVLVLVNGKRRHTSALVHVNGSIGRGSTGVDLNAIPASMIERIEVLKDGAAAQYGSDAIAGVINVILKSGAEPLGVDLKAGATTHGDGQLLDGSLHQGWTFAERGWFYASGEYRDREETNRAGDDPRPQGAAGHVPQPNFHWGDSDAKDMMAFFNGAFMVGDDTDAAVHVYSFGGLSRREGSHGGFFRRALQDTNQPAIYPNGYLPLIEPEVTDLSLTGGARGAFGEWFWDGSLVWGDNEFEFNVANSLNISLGPSIPPNQTEFYAGTLGADQLVANLDVSRSVDLGLAGPLNVAFGLEARRDGYRIEAGEPNSYLDGGFPNQFGGRAVPGAQVFPGFRPSNEVDVHRDGVAVYLDLEGDVHRMLRVGIAGRFEDFDDFGSTSDYKLTLRLAPIEPLVLRAAVATGFRAPSLGQAHFSAVSTNFLAVGGQLVPFEVGTFPVESPVARALGAPALEPETSDHLSAGVVWTPIAALELAADYYAIDIQDRIVLTGNFTGARVAPLLAPFNATGARFFTNAIDTETRGYDLRAGYTMPLAGGTLGLQAGYNSTENEVTRVAATPPQLTGLELVLFDAIERRRVECGQPEDNLRLTADWDGGNLFTVVRGARYGEYCLVDRQVVPQVFAAEWVADLEVGYRFPRFTLAVGAQNLLDAFPDRNLFANSNEGIFTYPSHSPFGMNGRFVYSRVSFRF
jgi:iron complex outermembrane recepter protein